MVVIANGRAGQPASEALQALEAALREIGRPVQIWQAETPEVLPQLATRAVRERAAIVVAFGGDGTVNTVAQALAGMPVVLAVAPHGTFNYIAREYALPQAPEAIAAMIREGQVRAIAAGWANEVVFLNNASVGLYRDVIEARERHKERWGRYRLVAVASALVTAWHAPARLRLEALDADGRRRASGRFSLLFAGINARQFDDSGFSLGDAVRQGALGFVTVRALNPMRVLALLGGSLVGRVEALQAIETFAVPALTLRLPGRRVVDVVIDGEIRRLRVPVKLRVQPAALRLLVPAAEADQSA